MFYELTCSKCAIKDITKGEPERFLENFTDIFGVISYIILGKTEDYGNFTTNHCVESSLCHKKELSRPSRANKTLGYFGLRPSALASKTETTK